MEGSNEWQITGATPITSNPEGTQLKQKLKVESAVRSMHEIFLVLNLRKSNLQRETSGYHYCKGQFIVTKGR